MTEILVDTLIIEGETTFGISTTEKCINQTVTLILGEKGIEALNKIYKETNDEGFHTFDKFKQFVVCINYYPVLGISLKFINYNNNDDAALDDYLILKDKSWTEFDRNKIMELYLETKNYKGSDAKLVDLQSFF